MSISHRVVVGLLLLSSVAGAADKPTIAVMPFADLAGGKTRIGEALRETVTNDLVELGTLRVLERARIDEVITETKLQEKKTSLDAVGGVRVGTLLGANLIVTGAYQQIGAQVRLTARIIKVETGEISAVAKADGPSSEVLRLEDQLTGQLLGSAGLKRPPPRKRPTVKWRAVELYGDAVVENDPQKKRALLERVVGEDPSFVYATRDLEALQARMKEYSAQSSAQLSNAEQATLKKLDASKLRDGERKLVAQGLFEEMQKQRRYHSLEAVAQKLVADRALAADAQLALFVARRGLHKYDLALQAGETYLKNYPTGEHFRDVESAMHEIAEARKKRTGRRAEYEADLAEKRKDIGQPVPAAKQIDWDYAPCIVSRWNSQVGETMLKECSTFLDKWQSRAQGDEVEKVAAARFFVVLSMVELGQFDKARPLAEKLIADSDEWDTELRTLLGTFPTD